MTSRVHHLHLPSRLQTLPGLISWCAAEYTHGTALSEGGRSLTFGELEEESGRFAAGLATIGVRRGDRVGVLIHNSIEWVVALFAAAKLGCIVVGLNTWFQRSELARVLSHSGVTTLVMEPEFLSHSYIDDIRALRDSHPTDMALKAVVMVSEMTDDSISWATVRARGKELMEHSEVGPEDAAALIYTSGSTDEPKGVVLSHRSIIANAFAISAAVGVGTNDKVWSHFPLFFSGGLCNYLLSSLCRGAHVVLQDHFDPKSSSRLISDAHVTVIHPWLSAVERMIAVEGSAPQLFERVTKGTWPLDQWYKERGFAQMRGISFYGLTETATIFSATNWTDDGQVRAATNGRVFEGNELRIVDDAGVDVTNGDVGEILVRGFSLTSGYWRRGTPVDRDGFLHTNDLGSVDAKGFLHWHGRKDNVLKVSGFLVSAEEVEGVIRSVHGVEDAFVTSAASGSRDEHLVAFIISDSSISPEEVTRECRNRIASYKIPKAFRRVARDDVPFTGSGKIDRRRLKELAELVF